MKLPLKTIIFFYLIVLAALWAFTSQDSLFIRNAVILLLTTEIVDYLSRRLDPRPHTWPISGFISALILSLILDPTLPVFVFVIAPLLVLTSKHYLKFGKLRHLFNPAALSAFVISLVYPGAITWVGISWSNWLLALIIPVGIYTLVRQKRVLITALFGPTYLILIGLLYVWKTGGSSGAETFVLRKAIDPTFFFFLYVMLIEPITSAFPNKTIQMGFGFVAALLTVLIPTFIPSFRFDPFIFSLVTVNLVFGLLFVAQKNRPTGQSVPPPTAPPITA